MSYELVFRSLINSSDQLSAINNQLYSVASTFTPKMTIVGSFERDYRRSPIIIALGPAVMLSGVEV